MDLSNSNLKSVGMQVVLITFSVLLALKIKEFADRIRTLPPEKMKKD